MSMPAIDIVVPVWNKPVETRACLVNLTRNSPGARLILVNNGSDRETERLLEEFAEALDHRALLISSPVNRGFVRAVNLGLTRVEACCAAVVKQTSIVTDGWLEPLLTLLASRPHVGAAVPRLIKAHPSRRSADRCRVPVVETSRCEFDAMAIKKELYDRIGGFDEELDGETWCLNDFCRRARRAGYLTCSAQESVVIFRDETPLGSVARRTEIRQRAMSLYDERWGRQQSFCVYFPRECSFEEIRQKLEVILLGARQGHSFSVLVYPAPCDELAAHGFGVLHRNITLHRLPLLFAARRAATLAASVSVEGTETVMVAGMEGATFPGMAAAVSFAELEQLIYTTESEKYPQFEA